MTDPATLREIPITPDLVRGALELEKTATGLVFHRLPAWARAQCSDPQMAMAEAQPAGVRLAFRTGASALELDALPTRHAYIGAPSRPVGVYDVMVNGSLFAQASIDGGHILKIDIATGAIAFEPGVFGTLRFSGLPDGANDIEIWLPHNENVEIIALRADADIDPIPDDGRKRWLHHGSSISHGYDAASPTGTWPAVAAAIANVDLVNLGFGGNALLDPFVARTIRDTPADLISLKIGINLVNTDVMRLRAFTPAVHGFLDTIRERHVETPLLVIGPILCPILEDVPGPSALDLEALGKGRLRFKATGDPAEIVNGKLTLNVIRAKLERIVAQRAAGDPHLQYLDGRDLYGVADSAEMPLPDDLHPDAATQKLIGTRYADRVLSAALGEYSGPISR